VCNVAVHPDEFHGDAVEHLLRREYDGGGVAGTATGKQ
jgi:hypothetical protein